MGIVLPSVEEIQAVFFESGIAGWAGKVKPLKIPGFPGAHFVPWTKSHWQASDIYWTTSHSQTSFGTTVISYDGQPVWWMHYEGWYAEEAIPFLKEALLAAYRAGEFVGGRGPEHFRLVKDIDLSIHYCYGNQWKGSFNSFSGREKVWLDYEEHVDELGHHLYDGGLLICSDAFWQSSF